MMTKVNCEKITAAEISVNVNLILKENVPFSFWKRENIECHEAFSDVLSALGFHVILVKNLTTYNYVHPFAKPHPSQYPDFVSEFNNAKKSGHKVALFFCDINLYERYAAKIFGHVVCEKYDPAYNKHFPIICEFDKNDVIFATGNWDENGELVDLLHGPVMSRIRHIKIEEMII